LGNAFRKVETVEIYSVAEVAELTGKTAQSVRSWCRKNEVERDGKKFLITKEVLSQICVYYGVEPSQAFAFLETKEKEKTNFAKATESLPEETPLVQQMQQQIDFLKEELEKVRGEKDQEIERLNQQNVNLLNTNNYLIGINSVTKNLLEEAQEKIREQESYEVPHTEIVVEEVATKKKTLKQRFRDWLNS
jgi:DNA-binding transcriptional MerR regulator